MANKKHRVIAFRRKREQKTDYRKRLKLLSSGRVRLVFRRHNKTIIGQLIEYSPEGDKVVAHVNSTELRKFGWKYSLNNLPACYLTGLLLAKKAKKVKDAILDVGMHHTLPKSRIYAFVKGVIDGKIHVPVDESVFPPEERIRGEHIKEYANTNKNKVQFSKTKPLKITEDFEKVKKKIENE